MQFKNQGSSDFVHGSAYGYFRNEAFNANDADLKAVGEGRPEMRRNVYGAALGGHFKRTGALVCFR